MLTPNGRHVAGARAVVAVMSVVIAVVVSVAGMENLLA